ncbi:hypothetical protein RMCBS344292_16849 [Rhizopus microsporus]|nr:hypothetical protein RMCBS344292_16849 [Rhizopus microsporus]
MQPSIPPWQIVVAQPVLIETKDSFCSCCSCLSSISEGREQPSDGPSLEQPTMSPDEEKMTKKKLHAIDELLQTERDYVQDLSHLVEVCLQTLSKQQWIDNHHKSIIIRNASDILLFHKQFIITFHPVAHHWSMIAKAFLDQEL